MRTVHFVIAVSNIALGPVAGLVGLYFGALTAALSVREMEDAWPLFLLAVAGGALFATGVLSLIRLTYGINGFGFRCLTASVQSLALVGAGTCCAALTHEKLSAPDAASSMFPIMCAVLTLIIAAEIPLLLMTRPRPVTPSRDGSAT